MLGYRAAAQQLYRDGSALPDLAVLDIGVQDGGGEWARLAFDARLPSTPATEAFGPGTDLALVWSLRGAPHVHRRGELNAVAGALVPLSEADATGRLNETGPSVAKAGISALDQYATAVREMRAVVTKPTAKGAASTAVTQRLPTAMWRDCRACKAQHISDSAMRVSSLAAGLELQPGTAPPVLQRRSGARVAKQPDTAALQRLIRGYLTLLGPATPADVAGYLDVRRADLERHWPDDLVQVSVDGRAAWLPAEAADAATAATAPELVRLLGPFDPWLQARDRDLIVPDASRHKALWPVLGRPGVLLVDGEVAGTWRTRSAGSRLTITVEPFAPLGRQARQAIEAEAERVGAVRGATSVAIKQ